MKIRLYLEINQNRLFPSPGSASRYINISNEYERGGGEEEKEEERGGRKKEDKKLDERQEKRQQQ